MAIMRLVHFSYCRLAYFERKHKFYSQAQLQSEAQTHYIGQFVKQLYVLVLGLDVLGNPFGLVTGLKQGVEDFFYEPFQVKLVSYCWVGRLTYFSPSLHVIAFSARLLVVLYSNLLCMFPK